MVLFAVTKKRGRMERMCDDVKRVMRVMKVKRVMSVRIEYGKEKKCLYP